MQALSLVKSAGWPRPKTYDIGSFMERPAEEIERARNHMHLS